MNLLINVNKSLINYAKETPITADELKAEIETTQRRKPHFYTATTIISICVIGGVAVFACIFSAL